mgnify:CR=1 FL=1
MEYRIVCIATEGLLQAALVADPTCAPACSALGVLAYLRQRMTEAEDWFQQSIHLNPRGVLFSGCFCARRARSQSFKQYSIAPSFNAVARRIGKRS